MIQPTEIPQHNHHHLWHQSSPTLFLEASLSVPCWGKSILLSVFNQRQDLSQTAKSVRAPVARVKHLEKKQQKQDFHAAQTNAEITLTDEEN